MLVCSLMTVLSQRNKSLRHGDEKGDQDENATCRQIAESYRGWPGFLVVGGIAGMLAGLCYIIALVLVIIAPPLLNADGAATLQYVTSHKVLYIIEQALWLGPGVFVMIVFLALSMSLKHLNKSYVAIGGLAGIAAWALSLALPTSGGGAPALVSLGDQYMAATTAEQHTAFATAAEVFIAENTTTGAVGILTPVGILILSLVMLKGVFPGLLRIWAL